MDITHPINTLSQDLARAAQVGGSEAYAAAERLLLALDPAMRLAFIDVLSQAANEISAALPGVAISVRLEGRDPVFAIQGAPMAERADEASGPADDVEPEADEGDATARITLRLPEALKVKAEAMAARRGQSLNTWLVAAARAAAQDNPSGPSSSGRRHGLGRHVQGWAR
jgi:hypothetical protein